MLNVSGKSKQHGSYVRTSVGRTHSVIPVKSYVHRKHDHTTVDVRHPA